jgi:4-aminobutyrate aminotransferase-like enzyme
MSQSRSWTGKYFPPLPHRRFLATLNPGQCSIAFHDPYLGLIERLLPIMPHPSLDSFFFTNSGSEAIEAALKMVRGITRKQNIITMQGAYHGRTFGAMAITKSKTIYADGSSPLMASYLSPSSCDRCLTTWMLPARRVNSAVPLLAPL